MERKLITITSINKGDMAICREHRILLKDFIYGFIWQLLFIVLYVATKLIKIEIIYVIVGLSAIIYFVVVFIEECRKLKLSGIIMYAITLLLYVVMSNGKIEGKWIAICIVVIAIIDLLIYCICQAIMEKKYKNKISIKENKEAIMRNNDTKVNTIDLTKYYVIAENKNDIKVYDMKLYNDVDNSSKETVYEYFFVDEYTVNSSNFEEITSIEIGDTIITLSNIHNYI